MTAMRFARSEATLSPSAARAIYDRIGRWQDTQRFYEDRATADLITQADFLDAEHWRVVHHNLVSKWGVASEVLVAARRA